MTNQRDITDAEQILGAIIATASYRQWRRDQFIKAALTGILAAETSDYRCGHNADVAAKAVALADATLAAADKSIEKQQGHTP